MRPTLSSRRSVRAVAAVLTLALWVGAAALFGPHQAAAQRSKVDFADPHMTGYRYDGRFVLHFFDAMETDTTPCPPSGNMLTAAFEEVPNLQLRRPTFVHRVSVRPDTPEPLKRMIDAKGSCALMIEGSFVLAIHHGSQISIEARTVEPYRP